MTPVYYAPVLFQKPKILWQNITISVNEKYTVYSWYGVPANPVFRLLLGLLYVESLQWMFCMGFFPLLISKE
ncbi:MAG TPA: hypothetical protein ENH40_06465 [Nitrospirae bacterium]|nr:hypothetical protein [Nitrospirota bacterium]